MRDPITGGYDMAQIIDFLAGDPSPEEIDALADLIGKQVDGSTVPPLRFDNGGQNQRRRAAGAPPRAGN